jgi:hypothetical protein
MTTAIALGRDAVTAAARTRTPLPGTSSHRGGAAEGIRGGYVIDQWRNPEAIKIAQSDDDRMARGAHQEDHGRDAPLAGAEERGAAHEASRRGRRQDVSRGDGGSTQRIAHVSGAAAMILARYPRMRSDPRPLKKSPLRKRLRSRPRAILSRRWSCRHPPRTSISLGAVRWNFSRLKRSTRSLAIAC